MWGKSRRRGDATLELIEKPSDTAIDADGLTFLSYDLSGKKNNNARAGCVDH